MPKQILYTKGQRVGRMIFICEDGVQMHPSGRTSRLGIFKCDCGKEISANTSAVKNRKIVTCGCRIKEYPRLKRISHPLYRSWVGMRRRCNDSGNISYPNYGGRGIVVCKEWQDSLENYTSFVLSLSNALIPGFTIDRIDNDGNYEPGNVRWAKATVQAVNRRKPVRNTSGYVGVAYSKEKGKWVASITVNKKRQYLGSFIDLQGGVDARNRFISNNNLSNFKIQQNEKK